MTRIRKYRHYWVRNNFKNQDLNKICIIKVRNWVNKSHCSILYIMYNARMAMLQISVRLSVAVGSKIISNTCEKCLLWRLTAAQGPYCKTHQLYRTICMLNDILRAPYTTAVVIIPFSIHSCVCRKHLNKLYKYRRAISLS